MISCCVNQPSLQTFNFMKVPVDYQLLVVNSATGLESTFMCWCGRRATPTPTPPFINQSINRARAQDDWVAVVLSALKRLADGDGALCAANVV